MSAWGLSAAVRRLKRRAARLVLLTPLLLFVGRGWADQPALVANPEDALSRLEQIANRLLTRGRATPSQIQAWIANPPTPTSLLDPHALAGRLGYRNLSVFVGQGVVLTRVCLLLAWLVSTLGRHVFVLDIGKRLTVLSDLNFAIDRAFREAGIDIPFPQRDVHIIRHAPPATGSGGITSQGRT